MLTHWKEIYDHLGSIFKSRDITLPTKVHLVKAMVLSVVMYGCESWTVKKAECQELMLLNCGVEEDSWESLGVQGDPTSPFWRRSVLNIHWKDWCCIWNSDTLATWCEELTHLKRPWCWESVKVGGDGKTEDEMIGCHQWPSGHKFEQAPKDSEGQGSLACCSPWGWKESDTT